MTAVQAGGLPGCSDRDKRMWKYRSPEQNFQTALESPLGDERRDAVARIAESDYFDRDSAFAVLEAAARTDPVTQVRCIAIRTFVNYRDDRPIGPLLTVLQARSAPDGALPADTDVRGEAVRALHALACRGVLNDPQRGLVRDVLVRLLETDPSRNVRIASAEALSAFRDPQVLAPLIRAVRHKDFAIAERAESSLIALTGVTHDYDADAWETWVANTQDPFARAGQTPQTTRPAGPTWWDQQARAWRRALKLPAR